MLGSVGVLMRSLLLLLLFGKDKADVKEAVAVQVDVVSLVSSRRPPSRLWQSANVAQVNTNLFLGVGDTLPVYKEKKKQPCR